MRKTLLMSAALLGLGMAAPAFAQDMNATGDTGAQYGNGYDNGAAPQSRMGTPHWRHHRDAMRNRMVDQTASLTENGARPGHVPGVGLSYPLSDRAANIDRQDLVGQIAPTLPTPHVSPTASPDALLADARRSLRAGRTGEAQEALERAETRMLNAENLDPAAMGNGQGNDVVRLSTEARRAIARRDYSGAEQRIADAMTAWNSRMAGNTGTMSASNAGAMSPGYGAGPAGGYGGYDGNMAR